MSRNTFYVRRGKRIVDLLIAGPLLVLSAPLLGLIAALVRIEFGAPVIFRQTRPGRHERPFVLLKFRSMLEAHNESGELLDDRARLTPFGRFLRGTSLDELPELWNVLRGEMSLVGPRPLLEKYLPYYSEEERRRFELRPGITGLAQVEGRNEASWNCRLAWDIEYVENCSVLLDLRILWRTAGKVIYRDHVEVDPRSRMQDLDEERRAGAAADQLQNRYV